MVSFPVELARSTPPRARQCTRTDASKFGDGAADIHGIAAEAVKFCDDKDVAGFERVEQAGKAPALRRGDAARDRFGHHPARFDLKASGLDLLDLVVGRLADGRDADIGKGARHGRFRPERVSGMWTSSKIL
jgi:hypothetical protein